MTIPFIIDAPLRFALDRDTGLLHLVAPASFGPLGQTKIDLELHLTSEAVRQLLADLPRLEKLLAQAGEGPTKPDSVQ